MTTTTTYWVRGSFRQSWHLTRGSRRTLCGTPLGYGQLEVAEERDALRKCSRCQRFALMLKGSE